MGSTTCFKWFYLWNFFTSTIDKSHRSVKVRLASKMRDWFYLSKYANKQNDRT